MMKEIFSRGPIVSDLEVPVTFSYYRKGIFSNDLNKAISQMQKDSAYVDQILKDTDFINDDTLWEYNI